MGEAQPLDVSVVLPTYNEAASLPPLIPEIARALAEAGLRGEVVVVDDASPDGTADIAAQLGQTYPVRVIRRTQDRGLAKAVIAGFASSQASVCVVMDADGSHPPEALPEMVRMILADKAEIVVGSRHVTGGGSKDWPLFSQFKSRAAASLAVGLTSMTDPTTGFMAIRRELVSRLKLDPVGWKIVLEAVVKARPARLAEVPIVFTDRRTGESKQSLRVLGQYLEHLYKLYKFRFPALIELIKFCLVGVLGVFVDLSVVATLKQHFAMDTRLCQVFGFAVAVSFNFAINRRYSFEHGRDVPLVASYVNYLGANLIGLTLRMLTIHVLMALTALDRGPGYLLLSVIGIAIATFVNFFGAKYLAFAPKAPARAESSTDSAPQITTTTIRPSLATGWLAVGLGAALVWIVNLAPHSARTADEIVNGIMADHIVQGVEGFVHPSVTRERPLDWQRDALPAVGNTPVFPLLLATFAQLGSHGMDFLPGLVFALCLGACLMGVRPLDRGAASATVLIAASAPWLVAQFALLEFEPLVAALGALGFALLVRSEGKHRLLLAALAGLATGLGFATKMWLILPALGGGLAYLVVRAYEGGHVERSRWARAAALYGLGCALGGASHLIYVSLVAREDLSAWIESVYFGLFSGRGVTAAKLSQTPTAPAPSSWDYLAWLLRDHGALLIPLCLGMPALTRRMNVSRRAFGAATFAAVLALIPLSIPIAKEPLYMAPVLPFVYALAGLTLVAPDRLPLHYARVNRGAARFSLAVAGLLLTTWLVALLLRRAELPEALGHAAHVVVWTLPSLRVLRDKPVAPIITPCALASFALAAVVTLSGPRGLLP
ncbi:MAG: glycosyltransferase family 2 protein [Myxococcales bacterium]